MARERTPVVPASMATTTLIDLLFVQLGLPRRINVAWKRIGVYTAGRKYCYSNQNDTERESDSRFH
jgi:hypothetical protein